MNEHLYALILCGGGGTRLWPFSRENRPKQFLKIKGQKTLIRNTFERIKKVIPVEKIYFCTVPGYTDEIAQEIPEINKAQVIVEPARRDTGMAVSLGLAVIAKKDKDAVVANIWVDHVIEDEKGYGETLLKAAQIASEGESLVATGLKPKYAHTGLGYIKKGKIIDNSSKIKVCEFDQFIEKPDQKNAEKMVKNGDYLWNVGLFVWRVDVFLKELEEHSPELYGHVKNIQKALSWPLIGWHWVEKEYAKSEKVSVDYALAEKTKNFVIVEGKFDWYDVGSFSVMWEINKKDKAGNVSVMNKGGEWIGLETINSIVISEDDRLVGTYGLEGVVVIATKDAVLVTTLEESQHVKQIVEKIKAEEEKKKFL